MKKEIEVTGVNGTFKGFVEVKLNSKREVKKVSNNFIHEEEDRVFYYHSVTSIYLDSEGKAECFESRSDILNESDVHVIALEIEKKLTSKLEDLANNPKTKTTEDLFKENGYK